MNGWQELRREIEALPGYHPTSGSTAAVRRAAVLAIVDHLAAARGEPEMTADHPWAIAHEGIAGIVASRPPDEP